MKFEMIWASDEMGGIAKKGIIPWNVPSDLRHFRELTTGNPEEDENVVIMGRRTWDSLPQMFKPLKDRINVVITRDPKNVVDYDRYEDQVAFVPCFNSALLLAEFFISENGGKNATVFVIGGENVYQQAANHESLIAINETIINGDFHCDQMVPFFNPANFILEKSEELCEKATYCRWVHKNPQTIY